MAGEAGPMNITFLAEVKAFSVGHVPTVQWVNHLPISRCLPGALICYLKRSFKMKTIFSGRKPLSILGVLIDFTKRLVLAFVVLGRLVQGMGVGFALPLMFDIILEQVPES